MTSSPRTTQRSWPLLSAVLAACLVGGACDGDTPRQPGAGDTADGDPSPVRPDLVLVVVDTLRADHLSVYGYARKTSPGLERLAAQGVVFDDVLAQSSWTLPSMASLFTGRHVFVNAYRLPSAVPSLAERLQAGGYETAAFVANYNLGRENGFARGFDHFVNREDTGGETWDAFDLERAVDSFLAAHPSDGRPRFFYLHFLDPHWPYEPRDAQPLDGTVTIRDDVIEAWTREVTPDPRLHETFNRDRLSILADIDAYDREIVNVDKVLERLLPRLTPREHLVVVASDHGETLWDRKHHEVVVQRDLERTGAERSLREIFFRDHAYHMFRELLFTPLIVKGVGFEANRRVDTPVENVDILPTLLTAAGLPLPDDLDGHALQDVVSGRAAPRDVLYAHSNEATLVRVTDSDSQLIFPTATGFSFGMDIMVFNLKKDRFERRNLYDPAQRTGGNVDTLRRLLNLRERALADFDLYDDEPYDATSAEMRAKLVELGYVGDAFGTNDVTAPTDADDPDASPPRDGR